MITREHAGIGMTSGAIFSDCERYRYRLWRTWDAERPAICFLMLNPSTADEQANDPTIERCQRRAIEYGFGRIEIANMFPFRATNPDELCRDDINPLGPAIDANTAILDAIKNCSMIVCAWGNHVKVPARAREVINLVTMAGMADRLHAIKVNQDGSPAHPLYLPYDLKPVRYLP